MSNLLPSTQYSYKLKTKCPNGWTQWTSKYEFTMPDLRETKLEEKEVAVNVYPNPTSDVLYIDLDDDSITTAILTNTAGKELLTMDVSIGENEMNLSSLANGIYFIHFLGDDNRIVKKVVKH